MRTDNFLGRLVAALTRDTSAFRPVPEQRQGFLSSLVAALSRSTPAFDSAYHSSEDLKRASDSPSVGSIEHRSPEAGASSEYSMARPSDVLSLPSRNPHFIGRQDLLSELRSLLTERASSSVPRVVSLHGTGGIGKTQLALEYAYRHSREYDSIAWVPSSQQRVLDRLLPFSEERRLLVVVDGLDEVEESFQQTALRVLYHAKAADIVLTSRKLHTEVPDAVIEVKSFRREEAETFLLHRIPHGGRRAASDLAKELEGLPIALELAARYMLERDLTIGQYLKRFRQLREQLRRANQPVEPDTVARELVAIGR